MTLIEHSLWELQDSLFVFAHIEDLEAIVGGQALTE